MSESTADNKDPKTPPITPVPRDYKIVIEESKLDDETKAVLLAQHEENAEMRKTIQEMDTRERLADRDKKVEAYLVKIEAIRPDLAKKYKDEKDLGMLKRALEDAELLTSKYRDIALDDEGKEIVPPKEFTSLDPITGKLRVDTAQLI